MPSDGADQKVSVDRKSIWRIVLLAVFPLVSVGLWISLRSSPIISGIQSFACFADDYVIEDGYITGDWMQTEDSNHALIGVTIYWAHQLGGSCVAMSLEDNSSRTIDGYTISVSDDMVTINADHSLSPGESWQETRLYFDSNPWWIYRYRFAIENQGYLKGTRASDGSIKNFPKDVVFATVNAGSNFYPNPIIAGAFLTGVAIFVYDVILGIKYLSQRVRQSPILDSANPVSNSGHAY